MRVALKFAYDGKHFSGYARQPGQRTIEQELLDLFIKRKILGDAKTSCFRTASRTDRGVSALGNVCAFDTACSKEKIVNQLTEDTSDVFIYGVQSVEPDFYPRHATRREYRYYLKRNDLDVDALLSAVGLFTGEHNFQNFARVEPLKNPVRSIDNIVIVEKQDFLILDFYAQTFLWNQIRRIVSALEKRGRGVLSNEQIHAALEHPEQKVDFQMAAPEPLILKEVVYDFSFEYVKDYKKNLQSFENRIIASL
ncbi:MAG: tRNA pseudouridine(38-40) synthase TruA [Thermoplasmata archaeon]|nr:tRNA pseudouridine(38-40) synthase TruA [Thermoplasmata archaeon]MBE3138020.1 tRNA pseudouridine(38-40) synthase TruA [Thermoplasmata archaeon]MBE3141645.1 tRNA pseudouridine(38-40) synthase TruA [Thermoplasmata archaeon]MCJ7697668.1 tRNA pseudouridine(38-40) synthase TruA [Thermoplasmata archaeon]